MRLLLLAGLLCASPLCWPAGMERLKTMPLLTAAKANFGPGCNLELRIPVSAEFPITYSTSSGRGGSSIILERLPMPPYSIGSLYLGMGCHDIDTPDLFGSDPVRYDENQKQWVRDLSVALKSWDSGGGLRPDEVFAIDESIRVHALKNINSQGFAYTVDDWTGEETTRTRRLRYCLFRGRVALCGRGDVAILIDGPKGDLTPYVLEILRSVEFLPDAPPASAAAASQQ